MPRQRKDPSQAVKIRLPAEVYVAAVREATKRNITVAALTLLMFQAAAAEFFDDF